MSSSNSPEANNTNAGWVNIDLLVGKSGKPYAALNTYKPEKPDTLQEPEGFTDGQESSGIPF